MAEYYFKDFEDYIKNLSIQHKDVGHDDANNHAFIRFQSEQDIESIPNNVSGTMVVIDNFTGRAVGSVEEKKLQQNVSLLFLVNISGMAGDPYGAIQMALKKAMDIMFQFYARMENDLISDDCGPMRYLIPEQMNFYPVDGPVLENYYGWGMDLPFSVTAPAYDVNKWNIP